MSAFRYAAILLAAAALSAQSAPPPRRGESDNPSARAAWFMRFRQSLDGESPAQHRLEALRQAQAMPTLHRPRLAAAPQPGAAASGASPAVPSPELGGDWTELGPRPETTSQYGTVSGRVTALAVDLGKDPSGNTIYVGAADGGVWYSTNALSASPTFTPIGDNLPSLAVGAIALDDSTTPTTIYVGSGEGNNSGDSYYGIGIEKTTDGGKTWTLGNGPADFFGSGIEKLIVDATNPQILLAAVTESGVYVSDDDTNTAAGIGIMRSSDGGATWTQIKSGATATDLAYDPSSGTYYTAIRARGFYSSTDQGQTWQLTKSPFRSAVPNQQNFSRISLAVRAGVLYALITDESGAPLTPSDCVGDSSCQGLVYSADGGKTWSAATVPTSLYGTATHSQGDYDQTIAAPANSNLLVIGGIDQWSGTPGGTWTNLTNSYTTGPVHPDEHAIQCLDATHWFIGNDGGAWYTANAGASWTNLNATAGAIQFYSVTPDPTTPGRLIGGSQDNGTAIGTGLSASQRTWNLVWGGDGGHTAINPKNPQQLFTENSFVSLQRTDDGGQTFTNVVDATTIQDPSDFYVPFLLDPQDPSTVYLATTRVWRGPATPVTSGAGWQPLTPSLTGSPNSPDFITALAVSGGTNEVMYAGTLSGELYVVGDPNAAYVSPNWAEIGWGRGPVSAIAVDPQDPQIIYWGFGQISSTAELTKTVMGTSTTNLDISGNLPPGPINAIVVDPANPNNIYVATDTGVFAAGDGGTANERWTRIGDNLPATAILSLALTDAGGTPTLVAGTHGRGAWSIPALAPPMFTMSVAPSSATVEAGQPADINLETTSANGASTIQLSCSGAISCSVSPASVAAGSTAAIAITATDSFHTSSNPTIVLTADNGYTSQTANLNFTLLDFDLEFGGGDSGNPQMLQNTETLTVPLWLGSGFGTPFDAPIQVSCPSPPAGVTCTVSPSSVQALSGSANLKLQITPSATAAAGSYTLQIQATGGSITRSLSLPVVVTPFSLAVSPASQNADLGTPASLTLTTSSLSQFAGTITFSCSAARAPQLACAFSPATVTAGQSSVATIRGLPAGYQSVTVTATSGAAVVSADADINVEDFGLYSPATYAVLPGADSAEFEVSMASPFELYSGPIAVTCSATGVTCTLSTATLNTGQSSYAKVTISGLAALPAGSSVAVTLTGTGSGGLQHSATTTVSNAGGISLALTPPVQPGFPGDPVSLTATVGGVNGYTGGATLACATGVQCQVASNPDVFYGWPDQINVTDPPSTLSVTATTSEGGISAATSASLPIPTGDFSFTASSANYLVTSSAPASVVLTFATTNNAVGKVNLVCDGLPTYTQCNTISSASISNGSTSSLVISVLPNAAFPPGGTGGGGASSSRLLLVFAVLGLVLGASMRRRRPLLAAASLLLLASVACGGSGGATVTTSSGSGTPSGIPVTVTLTATDAAPGIAKPVSHSITIQVAAN